MITATIEVYALPKTVGEVRMWLKAAESVGMTDAHPLQDGMLFAVHDSQKTEFVDCGEHPAHEVKQDLLVYLHSCRTDIPADESKPE
jgi:hypothetical protein